MQISLDVNIDGHLKITDKTNDIVLVDKHNAIHSQNMSRIIARALAREPNYYIHRIAFGNGGTVTDPTGTIIFNPPNDGRSGSWESRLYNETYSEIVDELDINFGSDPGSAEPGNIRTGGGSVPEDDPEGGGVSSVEVGNKSNVIIRMFINKNEPTGQINTINDFGVAVDENERTFVFDEIGLYSPGKQAAATSGYSSVNVGNKTSDDNTLLLPSTVYTLNVTVDGENYSSTITTPSGGHGAGNAITYGDLCEGINSGEWITAGDDITDKVIVFITDRSGGTYPTIFNKESYGFLTFQSLTTGTASSVTITCDTNSSTDLLKAITNNICSNVNVNQTAGGDAGVLNDSLIPTNERERLLTHIVFPPITKTADMALEIEYTLTVSVSKTSDSRGVQVLGNGSEVAFP